MRILHLESKKSQSTPLHRALLWYQRNHACKLNHNQNIEQFPYPPYIRWDAPVVPTFTVTYGITRDYFYSGHTGLMLFSTFEWKRVGMTWLYYPNLVLTPFVVMVLLSARVHYTIDIVAACIFTFWLERNVSKHVVLFDRLWTFILE